MSDVVQHVFAMQKLCTTHNVWYAREYQTVLIREMTSLITSGDFVPFRHLLSIESPSVIKEVDQKKQLLKDQQKAHI